MSPWAADTGGADHKTLTMSIGFEPLPPSAPCPNAPRAFAMPPLNDYLDVRSLACTGLSGVEGGPTFESDLLQMRARKKQRG
jgi:hypothetical protein